MRGKSEGFVSQRRPRPWHCFCAKLSAIVLFAGAGENLQAAGRHARTATMAARIDAPRPASIRLASFARQRELGDGRQTLGDASAQYGGALLGATTRWPGTAASLPAANRIAASSQMPTNVAAISGPNSWGKEARFRASAVALNASNGRGSRVEASIPETLVTNYQVRQGTPRSVGLLRTDDLVRTGELKSLGIDAPASSGVQAIGLLSNSSSLNADSTDYGSQPPWSAPSLGASDPLNSVR